MSANPAKTLTIKRYSNRRFYDGTRGGHLSLDELHDLVAEGFDLHITDSKSGEDITNIVLTQIILDRHAAKLAIFPTPVLHQLIRTQQQFLGGVIEEFFRQSIAAQRAAQENWAKMLQGVFPGMPQATSSAPTPPPFPANPMDWAKNWFPGASAQPPTQPPPQPPPSPATPREESELDDLRRQLEALQKRVSDMAQR